MNKKKGSSLASSQFLMRYLFSGLTQALCSLIFFNFSHPLYTCTLVLLTNFFHVCIAVPHLQSRSTSFSQEFHVCSICCGRPDAKSQSFTASNSILGAISFRIKPNFFFFFLICKTSLTTRPAPISSTSELRSTSKNHDHRGHRTYILYCNESFEKVTNSGNDWQSQGRRPRKFIRIQ